MIRLSRLSCVPCLNSCWTLAINEGTLESVSCPSITCIKTRSTRDTKLRPTEAEGFATDPELVKSVVGESLKVRWEQLKERRKGEIGMCASCSY